MDPFHRGLIEIGLSVADRYGFALAGGYAGKTEALFARAHARDFIDLTHCSTPGFTPASSC